MGAEQKVAVITGASQGIGAALVKAYLDRNYRVVATARSVKPTSNADILVMGVPSHGFRGVLTELGKAGVAVKFIAHEMLATFVAAFQADVTAIGTAESGFETGREAGVGSTASIGPLIDTSMIARDGLQ